MLNKIKKNYFLFLSTFLIIYFFFNLLDGERGLFSYIKKRDILVNLTDQENILKLKIKNLELKNSLLLDNLDLDYIEVLIREKFLFGKEKEKTFLLKYE